MIVSKIFIALVLLLSSAAFAVSEDRRIDRVNSQEFVQYLDDTQEFLVSTRVVTNKLTLDGSLVRHRTFAEQPNQNAPEAISSGLSIYLNGLKLNIKQKIASIGFSDIEYHDWTANLPENQISTVEIFFYKHKIGEYRFNPQNASLTREIRPHHISAFDIRQFYLKGTNHSVEWQRYSPTSELNNGISKVDLHTHFGGALSAEAIARVAMAAEVPYPVELLEEMHVYYQKDAVYNVDGRAYIKLSEKNLMSYIGGSLQQSLSISLEETVSFKKMEDIYRWRGPLVKDINLLPLFLKELVKDYASGVFQERCRTN